ncbi:hypothetical protein GCM10010449_03110 [Streptomyces rectiviolaceus]|uniref:Uncharacterized protein n=1 Tax=Streptomyces rectiviolaceus TaxID=332591 RepID=A0ABP6M9D6_9ACTN
MITFGEVEGAELIAGQQTGGWDFLTNHARVLLAIARADGAAGPGREVARAS